MLTQAVAQFGVTAVLARLLSSDDFGLIAAANIPITFMQVIAEGGIGSAIVQRKELSASVISAAMAVALLVGAGCYAALAVSAFPLQSFFDMPGLGIVVVVLGLSALLSGTCGVLEGLLQRNMGFAAMFRVNLVTSVLGYAVPAIGLALLGAGVWALVAAAVGRVLVKFIMLAILVPVSIRPRWEATAIRDLAHFGFGLTQDRFWLWIAAQSAPLLIGRFMGQAQLGQFYLGSQLAILPAQYISTVVSAVYFPIVSRGLADRVRAGTQFLALMTGAFVLMMAFGLIQAVNADFIISTVYGSGWSGAVLVFEVLCVGTALRTCTQICDSLNIARGDVYALAGRRAIAAAVMVVGTWAVREYGLAEASWAIILSQVLMLLMTVRLAISGLEMQRSEFQPFLPRGVLAGVLLVVVNGALLLARNAGSIGSVSLLVLSIIANVLALMPVLMVMTVWMGRTGPSSIPAGR